MKDKHHAARPAAENQSTRLPCRGCTMDCPHYAHCDARPWRMTQAHKPSGQDGSPESGTASAA